MSFQVRRLHPTFFAEVTGLDLREPLDAPTVAAVTAAIDAHGVLVFRDQQINDTQQLRFCGCFGHPQQSITLNRDGLQRRIQEAALSDISNVDEHGLPMRLDHPRRLYALTTRIWHTDNSFRRPIGKYTFLCAKKLPAEGGETEFADMRAAWLSLPTARRDELRPLRVNHSLGYSRGLVDGSPPLDDNERRNFPPTEQPLVRVDGAGRETLYLASHAESVVGLDPAAGRQLLDGLMAHATRPTFVHSHAWRPGDLLMWDNRCTMHRAMPFDETRHVRELRRTTVSESREVGDASAAGLGSAGARAGDASLEATASR